MEGTGHQQIDIYGPTVLGKYLDACRRYSKTQSSYPIKVHVTEPGIVYEDSDYTVICQRLKHRIPAHGYRIVEKDRTGHFDVKKAANLGRSMWPDNCWPQASLLYRYRLLRKRY